MKAKATPEKRRMRGFEATGRLVSEKVRRATEGRGFAETRLLTHWPEVAGAEVSSMCRPVKVTYAKGGFGATLILLTTGANAPMLQASLPKLKERVNAAYGYAAINHIRITQTAPTGFAEGQADFTYRKAEARPAPPDPALCREVRQQTRDIGDEGLAQALESLGQNVLSKNRKI